MKVVSFGETVKYSNKTGKLGLFFLEGFPEYLTVVAIIFVFIYAAIRAYCLSITHDEAITFLNHARGSFFDILTYSGQIKSNSHLLNTLLIKMFTNLFGISEFVIRIPALIGLGLYLTGVYKILNLFLKRYSLLLGVCLLTWHPLMIDIYSCARGYSLALGFLTLGLYYFFRSINYPETGPDRKNYIIASSMFALSSLSHLSFLNIYVSMVGVYLLFELIVLAKRKIPLNLTALYDAGRNILFGIIPSFIFLLIVYGYPVIEIIKSEKNSYGGNNGFLQDTVRSLIEITFNKSVINSNIMLFSKAIIIALLFFAFLIIIRDKVRNRDLNLVNKYLICVWLLLLISSLGVITQHFLLNFKYPFDRFVIYLIPVFFLFVLLFGENIQFLGNKLIRVTVNIIIHLIIICLLITFIGQANFTHFIQWEYDASTKNMVADIITMNKDRTLPDNSVGLGITWLFEPSTNYYILKNNISWMRKTDRNGPEGKFDYYYVTPDYKSFLEKHDMRIIKRYEISGNYLAASNQFLSCSGKESATYDFISNFKKGVFLPKEEKTRQSVHPF